MITMNKNKEYICPIHSSVLELVHIDDGNEKGAGQLLSYSCPDCPYWLEILTDAEGYNLAFVDSLSAQPGNNQPPKQR